MSIQIKQLFLLQFAWYCSYFSWGYYLEYLFEYDNPWINTAWIMIMVIVADFATIDRSGLKQNMSLLIAIKYQIMIMVAILSGTILSVFLGVRLTNFFVFEDTDMLDESILKK